MIRLNWKAIGILVVTLAVLSGGAVALYKFQRNRTTARFLADAKAADAKGQREDALMNYDMYLARRPGDADVLLQRSKLLDAMYQNNQTDRGSALLSYEAVLDLRPKAADTRRRVAELLVGRRPDETVTESFQSFSKPDAEKLLRHVQILKSTSAKATPAELPILLEYQGIAELRLERIPAAKQTFQEALKGDPARITSATILALLLIDPTLEPNDPKEAGRVMDQMVAANEQIKDNPNLPTALLERAGIRKMTNQPGWQDDLARARKLDPKNIAVLLWEGAVAAEEGRLDDARTAFKTVIELQPKETRAYQQLAGVELRANHAEEAASWLRKGLEALGNRPDPNLSWFLTTILADAGKSQEARTALEDYRNLRPTYDNPQLRLQRAAQSRFVDGIIGLGEAKTTEDRARVATLLAGIDAQSLSSGGQGSLAGAYYRTLATAYVQSIDRDGPPSKAQQARNNAIAAYRKAIVATPTSAQPVIELAQLLRSVPIDPTLDPKAREAAIAERDQGAIDLLEQTLSRYPSKPEDAATRENLGMILAALIELRIAEQNRLPASQRSWSNVERLLTRGREEVPTSRVLNQLAIRYFSGRERASEITELLRKQLADPANAKNADLWAALAQSYSVQGKPDEAIKTLDEAEAQAGDKVVLRLARAVAERARGDLDAALAALTNNIEAIPTDDRARIWQEVAAIQLARPDYGAARAAIQRWAALRPRLVDPRRDLFAIAIQLKDEQAAKTELAEIENLDGKSGFQTLCARFDLAQTFLTPQDSETAIAAILKAYPERWESHFAQGIYLEEKKNDVPGAIAAYKAALAISPSSTVASRLAALYAKAGELDDLELLRQQIGVSPMMTQISVKALASAGQKDRAAELAAEMAQGSPEALNLQVWQANVLKALGDPEQAQQKLRDLIKANPKDLSPWASLLMLQLSQKQLPEAKATVEEMKKNVEVERPELLWTRCALLLGDSQAADKEIEAAMAKFPDDPIVLKTAVQYYRQTGRGTTALATLRAIHKRQPEARWVTNQLAEMLASSASTWAEALSLVEPPPPAGQETSIDRLVRANVYALGPGNAEKEKAIALLKQLVDDPSNSMTVQTRLLLAQLYNEQGRTVEALEQARLASINSTNLPALNFYIRRALDIDRIADARQALDRLAQSDPDGLGTAVLRARILQKENKPAEAIESLQKALATLSGAGSEVDPASLLEIAPLLFELGDAAAGASAIEQAASLRPDLAWAMIPALAKVDRIDEAFALAEKTVGTEQVATATALLLQAMLQRKIEGQTLTRLDALLDAALKVNPKVANLLIGQAQVRHFQGRFEEEIAIYKDVLKSEPNRGDFLNNMAWTLSESLNKPEEALTYIDQALAKIPNHPSITDTKGVILTRLKDYDKAIAVLQASAQDARIRLPAIYPVVLYHLARAYQGAGREAESKQALAQALRLGFRVELLSLEERQDAEAFLKQNAPPEPAKSS